VLASIAIEKSTWYQRFVDKKDVEITLEEALVRDHS